MVIHEGGILYGILQIEVILEFSSACFVMMHAYTSFVIQNMHVHPPPFFYLDNISKNMHECILSVLYEVWPVEMGRVMFSLEKDTQSRPPTCNPW
jgi:hypothetical protein